MTAKDRYEELKNIMSLLMDVNGIDGHGRSTGQLTLARTLISLQMRKDGFPVIAIGQAVGRKHSTIVSLTNRFIRKMDNEIFRLSKDCELWWKFVEIVNSNDNAKASPVYTRTICSTLGEFRRLTDGMPDETTIRIKDNDANGMFFNVNYDGDVIQLCSK